MCGIAEMRCFVVVMFFVVSAIAAPVSELKQETKRSAELAPEDAGKPDADLQDLMKLVEEQAGKDDVMVHKHEMTHIQNVDGETHTIKETEEKVIDSSTGEVLAAVKQEVKQNDDKDDDDNDEDSDDEGTVVETKVDIPSAGIHEEIVQEGAQQQQQDDEENDNGRTDEEEEEEELALMGDLTPSDMAEFLLTTQQFDLFYSALDKLVSENKMTADEAEEYARVVAAEYQRLEDMSEPEAEVLVQQRSVPEMSSYYEAVPEDRYPSMVLDMPTEDVLTPEEKYITYIQQHQLQQQQQQLQQQQQQQQQFLQQQEQEEAEINPYDFLTALWEEAFDRGNQEAQAIVQMLYDRVSKDDNEDDMGQIRDILVDTVANSFTNDDDNNMADNELIDESESVPYQENDAAGQAIAQLENAQADDDSTNTDDVEEQSEDNSVDDNVEEEAVATDEESKDEEADKKEQ